MKFPILGLVYNQWCSRMSSYFKVSAKNSWEHQPCQLKLVTWKASSLALKAIASKSFSSDTMLVQKDNFKTKQHFLTFSFCKNDIKITETVQSRTILIEVLINWELKLDCLMNLKWEIIQFLQLTQVSFKHKPP